MDMIKIDGRKNYQYFVNDKGVKILVTKQDKGVFFTECKTDSSLNSGDTTKQAIEELLTVFMSASQETETNKGLNDMNNYYKPHLVAATAQKDITLPFNGLYHSYLGELLDVEIESISDELSEQGAEDLSDFVYSLDLRQYNKALTDGYANHLIDTINDIAETSITIDNVEYVPMNGQNRGDTLHALVNINTLPVIPLDHLQPYATEALTSNSGFSSFYSPDLTPLKGARLENWSDVYISFIIDYLANDLYTNEWSNAEQSYIELLQCNGGAIELLMANISSADCDKLNELLQGEQ